MKLRIRFSKCGPVKFIGHLDIMRYFQKAMRRADIDIAYTEGFSPHQKMSFANPLGVGIESMGEYFDIEVNSITTSEDMICRLNAVMAEGIRICSIRLLEDTTENAMACIRAAKYTLISKAGTDFDIVSIQKAMDEWSQRETYVIQKETKSGFKEIDLIPAVRFLAITDQKDGIEMITQAGSSLNIKPELVMESLLSIIQVDFVKNDYQIIRQDLYTCNDANALISLGEIGEEF